MINPTHRLKKFVKYAGNEKPATFYVTDHSGWLGSGVTDCNGQEIFEGDKLAYEDRDEIFIVTFEKGAFCIEGQPLCLFDSDSLIVVGHIATEEQT